MHLGYFYLTELLLGENPRMRVVNTSSIAHHLSTLMTSLLWPGRLGRRPGCPDNVFFRDGAQSLLDESRVYVRAKLANTMYTVEMPWWGGWARPSFCS
jgi:NAD(P)-dependent dehydrogenase (short-subunit alcohol dehydrogenase family)